MGCSKNSTKRSVYNDGLQHSKRGETSNNITLHLKELEKEQAQLKASKRKETKIRAEVNQIEGTNQIENRKTGGETRNWIFENINKTNKPLVRLTEKKKTQHLKIRKERGCITTDASAIKNKKIIRDCCEQLYANKLDNLDEIYKFLETYNPLKLNQEETEEIWNRLITNKAD